MKKIKEVWDKLDLVTKAIATVLGANIVLFGGIYVVKALVG